MSVVILSKYYTFFILLFLIFFSYYILLFHYYYYLYILDFFWQRGSQSVAWTDGRARDTIYDFDGPPILGHQNKRILSLHINDIFEV
jgi:hypothetical protein